MLGTTVLAGLFPISFAEVGMDAFSKSIEELVAARRKKLINFYVSIGYLVDAVEIDHAFETQAIKPLLDIEEQLGAVENNIMNAGSSAALRNNMTKAQDKLVLEREKLFQQILDELARTNQLPQVQQRLAEIHEELVHFYGAAGCAVVVDDTIADEDFSNRIIEPLVREYEQVYLLDLYLTNGGDLFAPATVEQLNAKREQLERHIEELRKRPPSKEQQTASGWGCVIS